MAEPSPPPGADRRRQLTEGLLQALPDCRRHRSVQGVMAQHFFCRGKLAGGRLLGLLARDALLFVFEGSKFGLAFHILSGFLKKDGKRLARPMQFSSYCVGGLLGEGADVFVTKSFVRDEQQQEAIFVRQSVEGFLNALAQFLGFQDPQR